MSKSINVEITTQEQRDELVKQLQGMSFDREVKSWEELKQIWGWFVNNTGKVKRVEGPCEADSFNENIWATEEQAVASVAMAQLSQLMKFYNDGWVPDWSDNSYDKYVIHVIHYYKGEIDTKVSWCTKYFLAFPTQKIRDKFLENHRDLIEQAKPLL